MSHSLIHGLTGGQEEPCNSQCREGCARDTQLGLWECRGGALPILAGEEAEGGRDRGRDGGQGQGKEGNKESQLVY